MLIDTHSHINFKSFKDDGHKVIKKSLAKGVWMINVGSQYTTSERAVFEYAKKYEEGVYAAVGLHPLHLAHTVIEENIDSEKIKFETRTEQFVREKYEELAKHPKVVAIGEIGFDNKAAANFETQKSAFLEQLQLAGDIKKPVIIHCRGYHDELIEILKNKYTDGHGPEQDFIGKYADKKSPASTLSLGKGEEKGGGLGRRGNTAQGVIHFFSGDWAQAQEYFNLGFLLSFTGVITFARDYDEVIKQSPLEKLMVETDCPYVAPEPFRGERNEPIYVEYIARRIAEIKKISFEEVAEQTTKNARALFGI